MGELSVAGLADFLRDIADHSKTGVLRMSVAGHFRMAFFDAGNLVYLVSDIPEENLAAFLSRAGRIESAADRLTLFQLEKEVTRTNSLVSLIVERGVRDADSLREWLIDYACMVFARAFDACEQAPGRIAEGVRAEHPLPFQLPVYNLIVEAVRRMESDAAIHTSVGPVTRYTRPTERYNELLQVLPLSFFDGLVAAQLFDQIAVQDLLVVSGISESDTLRSLLTLRCTGVIEPFFDAKTLTDSARLRIRQNAVETGYAMDPASAAAALGFVVASSGEDGVRDAAITMGELDGSQPFMPTAPPRGHSAPLQYPPVRPRGDTGRLKLLASAYVQMGEAEAAAGNFVAAVQCFESALSQKPNDLETMVAYAGVLAKRPGGFTGAENVLNKASEMHPKSAKPMVALAKLYKRAGRTDDCEDMLLEARRIEPNNGEIRQLFDELKKGGGLLSRLGFKVDPKQQQQKSGRTPPPPPQRRGPLTPIPMGGAEEGQQLRCRHCGKLVKRESRVCMNCGATQ